MKRLLLSTVLFLSLVSNAYAASNPGERPDQQPNRWNLLASNLEDKIVEKAQDIKATNEEFQNAPERSGTIWVTNPKKTAKEKLEIKKDELKDLLASTPTGSEKSKDEYCSKDKKHKPNKEIIEVKFSLNNLMNLLKKLQEKLQNNPSNLDTAIKYYETYIICLNEIIEMHQSFVKNSENSYKTEINNKINQFAQLIDQSEKMLSSNPSSVNRSRIINIKNNQESVMKKLNEALNVLAKQKTWAENNLPQLQELLPIVKLAYDTSKATKDAKVILDDINSNYAKLKSELPPLIVFEIDLSQLELKQ